MPVAEAVLEARLAPFRALNERQLAETPWWDGRSRYEITTSGTFVGRNAIVGYFVGLLAAMPDLRIDVERSVVAGPLLVAEWRLRGTFTGSPLEGLHATGAPVELRGVDVMEWEDDIVRSNVVHGDGLDFARQVGMLPRRGTTLDRLSTHVFNLTTRLKRGGGR